MTTTMRGFLGYQERGKHGQECQLIITATTHLTPQFHPKWFLCRFVAQRKQAARNDQILDGNMGVAVHQYILLREEDWYCRDTNGRSSSSTTTDIVMTGMMEVGEHLGPPL